MLNNKVNLSGELLYDFSYSHEYKNEKFFCSEIKILKDRKKNDNENFNIVKIICKKSLIENNDYIKGDLVNIEGEFHSYNDNSLNERHLLLFCFVKKISKSNSHKNFIYLNGYVCKLPSFRIINNKLKICDLLIAVNRNFNKSDYIPCIAYNSLADILKNKSIGYNISFDGAIQSRNYIKKYSETNSEYKIAYEVIIKDLKKNN